MRRTTGAVTALALVTLPAVAQEPLSIESVAARYAGAESYCETGKWGMRDDPKLGFTRVAFSRCVHRDGRFKLVEHIDQPRKAMHWSDGKKHYRYSEYANIYQEYAVGDHYLPSLPGNRSQVFPFVLSSSPLQSYKASSALSTPQHSVFERFDDAYQRRGARLWVLNADKSIVRYEEVRDGVVLRFVEISSQELDRPLTAADLSHNVPLWARYSLQNNPRVFVTGLFVLAGIAGALIWGWLFARTANLEDVLHGRRRLWRLQFWCFGGIAIALAVLAAIAASVRDSGHPPAIVFVYVAALWCAVAFALTACFTLMSYPVQWISRLPRGDTPSPPNHERSLR